MTNFVYIFQAIYNVLVSALFILLAWAVYYVVLIVLEPFLVPLFWAVLTGFVIHPYKSKLTEFLQQWLINVNEKNQPSFITSFQDALTFFNWSLESVGSKIISKWKFLLILLLALPVYHFVTFYPLDVTTPKIVEKWLEAFHYVEFVTWPIMASCAITYVISVLFLYNEKRRLIFQIFGCITWLIIFFYGVNLIWPPIWMILIIGTIFYSASKVINREGDKDEVDFPNKRQRFRQAVLTVLSRMNSTQFVVDGVEGTPAKVATIPSASSTPFPAERIEKIEHPGVSALKKPYLKNNPMTPQTICDTPLSTSRLSKQQRNTILKRTKNIELGTSQETSSYIKTVFWACICVQLFLHPSLLHLLPIPVIYTLFKKVWSRFGSYITDPLNIYYDNAKKYLMKRKDAFLPGPVEMILTEIYKMEREFLKTMPKFLDTLVTILLISAMIVFVVLSVVFISAQMYSESLYIVQTSGKLVTSVTNSTYFQHVNSSIGMEYFKQYEDLIDSGYKYGREYISSSVVSVFRTSDQNNDNQESVDEFEQKLLELWDRIYQYWLSHQKESENNSQIKQESLPTYGPDISQAAIASSMEEIIHRVLAILDLSAFSQFTMKNMGTLISVLEQGWTLLKGNVGFALTILSEVLRILFHGGSGMINFVLSVVVYFTALFYLLASNEYKPVELISTYTKMWVGNGFANALHKGISSVFKVTFKMASFYGLWTYLTHTVFNASIITVPVLVSTFLAAVPVAGQYPVALPAALELWVLKERPISALALLLCHVLPTYVVDVAFYSEIKQGIHPWITGLSIVGGVYYFGICGAIYGPLFLCGMYVILSVYMGWLQDIPLEQTMKENVTKNLSKVKTPVIKRSESIY